MSKTKLTRRILTGLVLLVGASGAVTVANEVNNVAVNVNKKDVKASVYEKDGHYYVKLTTAKNVTNVVARVTTEDRKEYVVKKEAIKAGEVVEYEIDINAAVPTRKLPHTAVKRETVKSVVTLGDHTFNAVVSYDVEVADSQEQAAKPVDKNTENKTTLDQLAEKREVTSEQKAKEEAEAKKAAEEKAVVDAKLKQEAEAKAKAEKEAEAKKTAETKAAADAKVKQEADAKAVADAKLKQEAEAKAAEAKKAAELKAKQEAEAKAKEVEAKKAKQQTPATPTAGSREEQIRRAFLDKVAKLRSINGLPALSENAALNSSSKFRSSDVTTRAIDGNIHGPNGTIQYETNAARAAGYANYILANIAITSDSGTPEQVAQQLFDILFKEIGNVVPAYPYGHRNTLLDETARDVGAGVTIKNGQVYLVQHQSSNGVFNGTTAKAGKYLDGSTKVYLNGK
ncbi:CAP domain-containing protein [uncultured Gemella sp.]|uniref:CAP domain-containing protein n=1 Tax=uncultured Gemella sp. TaxID=254352 RepID=UPI0028EA4ACB|nr:CAP domain-containing protein [uncultured Gemella sp.]